MSPYRRLVLAVVVSLITATACRASAGGSESAVDPAQGGNPAITEDDPTTADTGTADSADPAADGEPARSPLADADLALPQARGLDELTDAGAAGEPVPTTISIDRLGLDGTAVLAVGIERNGDMTVPPPTDVGWYRYGPAPGESGSAVLAGHIASGGVDGAFRHLDRLVPGDTVTVGFDDGSTQAFVVDELIQVDKTELPFDTLFARSGPVKLALITCGGEFDPTARSYTDNVVVTAIPAG